MYPIGSNVIHRDLSDTAVIERRINNITITLIPLLLPLPPTTMSAKLIWITPAAEHQIEYCARVSNPKGQQTLDTTGKLLKYLVKHKHWSPFEMASACFEINTTRDISAQILRHRSFSFQEFSQRYASTTEGLGGIDIPQLRRQDHTNRQNSTNDLSREETQSFYRRISSLFEDAEHLYQEMLSSGVAKESARKILPMNSPTRLYMAGTIRSWLHYLQVRRGPETQIEHRVIAEEINRILNDEMPNLWEVIT
jgi:thymidylate synthase (FAD)